MIENQTNLNLDEIIEIKEVGIVDTYDFIVPESHCFIANGFLVHNSRDIENNADNVWELKRKGGEEKFAKLTATKGKDTGTWQTWLRFDRFIQKFYDCEEQYEI